MRKDEAVGNKKKMQVCLPKYNYKLDNNFLTVELMAVDLHCLDADPDPAQNLDADPDPDPGWGGGGRSPKNVHPPWQNPRYAPGTNITQRGLNLRTRTIFPCAAHMVPSFSKPEERWVLNHFPQ
jgi:hypothetical protein